MAGSGQLAATLRGGKEYARYADRPGGDNRQLELALHGSWLLAPRTRLEAHWSYSRLHDSAGYSPLLEAGARRRQQRRHGQLSVRHALDAYWEASASIDWQRQESNLAIFRQQARQFTLRRATRFLTGALRRCRCVLLHNRCINATCSLKSAPAHWFVTNVTN